MHGSWPDPQQGGENSVSRGHLITGSQKLDTKPVPTAHPRVPELPGMSATLRETGQDKALLRAGFPTCEIGCEDV